MVRTLVLFDGQRVVTSNPNSGGPPAIGGVDLSTIPSSVIERVDVVTGGASAAWGSDAVAGVVNLVINKNFSGFKANAAFGNSSHNDHKSYKFEFVTGTDFLGGRGHTEFAANYTMSPDTMYNWNRNWYDHDNRALYSCAVVNGGPATALCHTPSGVYSNSFTNGGLITASAAAGQHCRGAIARNPGARRPICSVRRPARAAAANALKGIQFVGPNAQQVPFNFGVNNITPGTNAVGSNCYNCSANVDTDVTNAPITAVPYHNYNLFSYTSYKLTDDITASLMLNYGWNAENNQANNGRQANYTIKVDNAFIPDVAPPADDRPGHSQHHPGQRRHRESDESQRRLDVQSVQVHRAELRPELPPADRGVFTLTGAYQPVRRGLVVERLCPEQLGARAPMGPPTTP